MGVRRQGRSTVRVYIKSKDGKVEERESLEGLQCGEWSTLWIDLEGKEDGQLTAACDLLSLHPLSVENCRSHSEVPKVQAFPNHLFIAWSFIKQKKDSGSLVPNNVCMFLGDTWLITDHAKHIAELDDIMDRIKTEHEFYAAGPSAIVYSILDTAVDEYFPLVENLTEKIDGYVDDIVEDKNIGDVKLILAYKQTNMALRRVILSHRDVVLKLTRRDMAFIPAEVQLYILDVYDHLARQSIDVEANTDLISSSLDIHLNAVNNRLNVTMKRLTAIATIFMPLTFLTGLYGMNFRHMPELSWRYGYLAAWGVLLLIAVVMIVILKKKHWF